MFMKTLMIGCVAGEAQLDDGSDAERAANAELLARDIEKHALAVGARLIVLKEFPSSYRGTLACFERRGFIRIPSMPLTRLNIAYRSFDEYMQSASTAQQDLSFARSLRLPRMTCRLSYMSAMTLGPISTRSTRCTSMFIDVQSCILKG